MIRFLGRWLLYIVAIPIALALCFALLVYGLVAISYMHEEFGGWFWLGAWLTAAAAIAAAKPSEG